MNKSQYKIGQRVIITDGERTALSSHTGKIITIVGFDDTTIIPAVVFKRSDINPDYTEGTYFAYFSCIRPLSKLEAAMQ